MHFKHGQQPLRRFHSRYYVQTREGTVMHLLEMGASLLLSSPSWLSAWDRSLGAYVVYTK